VELVQ
jgi:hypothetical protein